VCPVQWDVCRRCGPSCISDAALAASAALANTFVDAARSATHSFSAEAFAKITVYNRRPYGLFEEYASYGYYYIPRDGGGREDPATALPSATELDALHGVAAAVMRRRRGGGGGPSNSARPSPPAPPPPPPPPPPLRGAGEGPLVGILSVPDPPCVAAALSSRRSQRASRTAGGGGDSQSWAAEHRARGGSLAGAEAAPTLSCFTTFYADWLHTSGARVVPIPFTASAQRLRTLFDGVQGLLFTGGGADVTSPDSAYHLPSIRPMATEILD
jgi:hypothetical protein